MKKTKVLIIGVDETVDYAAIPNIKVNVDSVRDILLNNYSGYLTEADIRICKDLSSVGILKEVSNICYSDEDEIGTIIIYYCGHGFISKNDYEYYLSTKQTEIASLEATSILARTLKSMIENSKINQKMVFLDSCFSEAFIKGVLSANEDIIINSLQAKDLAGTFIVVSSAKNKTSTFSVEDGAVPTDFTNEILSVATEGIPVNKEIVSTGDLYSSIYGRLKSKGKPLPIQFSDSHGFNIPFLNNSYYLEANRSGNTINSQTNYINQTKHDKASYSFKFTGSILDSMFEIDRICQLDFKKEWLLKNIIEVYNETVIGFEKMFPNNNIIPNNVTFITEGRFENQSIAVVQNKLFRFYDDLYSEITSMVNKSHLIFFHKNVYKYSFGIRAPFSFLCYFIVFALGRITKVTKKSIISINYTKTYELLENHIYSGVGKLLLSEYDSYTSYDGYQIRDRIHSEVKDYINIFGFTVNDLTFEKRYHKDTDGAIEAITTKAFIDNKKIEIFKNTLRELHLSIK